MPTTRTDTRQFMPAREERSPHRPPALHFTPNVLQAVRARGVSVTEITLHVGYGTFEPVRTDELQLHRVAPEWSSITSEAAATINHAHERGGRVIAVGTTTTRAARICGRLRWRYQIAIWNCRSNNSAGVQVWLRGRAAHQFSFASLVPFDPGKRFSRVAT